MFLKSNDERFDVSQITSYWPSKEGRKKHAINMFLKGNSQTHSLVYATKTERNAVLKTIDSAVGIGINILGKKTPKAKAKQSTKRPRKK